MKRGIIFGFGSEIGCKLVELSLLSNEIIIDTVINNSHGSVEDDLNSLKAKLIFSNPKLLKKIKVDYHNSQIVIGDKKINCIFKNIDQFLSSNLNHENAYDFGILATNKIDISNQKIIEKLIYSTYKLFGVAESNNHESIYFPLLEIKSPRLNSKNFYKKDFNYFALGSCQSIGWTSTLSVFITWLDKFDYKQEIKIISSQVDIVHPDTPQGRFGTKSFNPRDQDARNNLRPSFSQVKMSMNRVLPDSINISSVSLRTCIEPPGYQISRFLVHTSNKELILTNLNYSSFYNHIKDFSKNNPEILNYCDEPYGSKAFSEIKTASTILSSNKYLTIEEIFSKDDNNIYQITIQSYVHNTLGYSNSIIRSIEKSLIDENDSLQYFEN